MNDEIVVYSWPTHYLRDDRATEICDYERYSLFKLEPYERVVVLSGSFSWALDRAKELVND